MCKVYNSIGSLTAVKLHLQQHNIKDFNSINELIAFQKGFANYKQQLISEHEHIIEQEKISLGAEVAQSESVINSEKIRKESELRHEIERLEHQLENLAVPSNFIRRISNAFKKRRLRKKFKSRTLSFDSDVAHSMQTLVEVHTEKNNRYQYIVSQFAAAVNESCSVPINELERKKRIIDEVNTSIYGALGEQQVVKELEKLPDDYFLINDFSRSFSPPIYNRQENDKIWSIQIDHILIAPSGIFLIETKNWSEKSMASLSLRSPVQQIKRTNYALFTILNREVRDNHSSLRQHHWGDRKISVKNLIVLTKSKPPEEFQHVTVLTVEELPGYIKYFKPIFSIEETQWIADYLLKLNQK